MFTAMLIRRSHERGHAQHGWLDSHHTFSFADYYDPRHMGFGALRVINEDRVAAGEGFPTHGHRDMEILSYVLAGELEHRDSMGNGSVLRPGHVQRMSAGTGVRHSEFNASQTEPVHFLQIWIEPASRGSKPGYEERIYSDAERQDTLRLIASRDGRDGSVQVHQDLDLFATLLAPGAQVQHTLAHGRRAWVHVARGEVTLNGERLAAGDAAAITEAGPLALTGAAASEVLVFDLA
jgi:redox-sensitive bicupin YhaK (pirin superfamily)